MSRTLAVLACAGALSPAASAPAGATAAESQLRFTSQVPASRTGAVIRMAGAPPTAGSQPVIARSLVVRIPAGTAIDTGACRAARPRCARSGSLRPRDAPPRASWARATQTSSPVHSGS